MRQTPMTENEGSRDSSPYWWGVIAAGSTFLAVFHGWQYLKTGVVRPVEFGVKAYAEGTEGLLLVLAFGGFAAGSLYLFIRELKKANRGA